MSASPPPPTSNNKKPIRELSSITNHLLLTKTLNALATNNNNAPPAPAPPPSTSSIKENIPNDPNSISQQKSLNLRLAAALKPVDRDNVAALLQFYQTLTHNNLHSNGQNHSSLSVDNSSSVSNPSHLPLSTNNSSVCKSNTKKSTSMTYLCRYNQRNRLIDVPPTSEFYHQHNGISHEHLRQLIVQEFQLQKTTLIIQIWNEQYQEYIDIESYKKIPSEGRLQVLIDKSLHSSGNSPSMPAKSPTTTPVSSSSLVAPARSITPIPLQSTPNDQHHDEDLPSKAIYEEPVSTVSPMHPNENLSHSLMYDLLPKPSEGIPIPRFPPHIAAFLNGTGDANQLNALVQALYQEIVKYELYPNADELRSIVSRLVDRHPISITVIGSIELLVRKLYYKFCNERKKYPVELKRRQPNKRKRLMREDEASSMPLSHSNQSGRQNQTINDLDRLMHLWTNTTTMNQSDYLSHPTQDGFQSPAHSPSGSSSNSSSPDSNRVIMHNHSSLIKLEKIHPLNLSMTTTHHSNLMCTE